MMSNQMIIVERYGRLTNQGVVITHQSPGKILILKDFFIVETIEFSNKTELDACLKDLNTSISQ